MERRFWPILGTLVFLVLAPGVAGALVPWWITRWTLERPDWSWAPLRVAGGLLVAAGAIVVLDSFARFALQGLGTPAPLFPPRRLVVRGLYRFVRNPMYVALIAIIFGQALVFASPRLAGYAALFWLCAHIFVVAYEERTLRRRFGEEYAAYRKNVPRWIPHLRPWRGGE